MLEIKKKFPDINDLVTNEISRFTEANKISILWVPRQIVNDSFKLDSRLKEREISIGWKDCSHILMSQKLSAILVTWDRELQLAAERIGVNVAEPSDL